MERVDLLREERVREKSVAWGENSMDARAIGGLIDRYVSSSWL